jgi:hypothetical protein
VRVGGAGIAGVPRRMTWGLLALALVVMLGAPGVQRAEAKPAPRSAPQSPPCAEDAELGGYCGDGGYVNLARFAAPRDVALEANGDVLIADGQNSVIRRVSRERIRTVAGIGVVGDAAPRRPTSVADVALADPRGVAALPDGSFAIADAGLRAVLLVTPDGLVRTLLDRRDLTLPVDVTALDADTVVVADAGAGSLVEVNLQGGARTLAGGLAGPRQVAPDPASGGLIVSEAGATPQSGDVVRLAPDGSRTVVAGPGAAGRAGELRFARVAGVVALPDGTVLVADRTVVRAVFPNGEYRDVAGGNGEGQPCGLPIGGVDLGQIEGIAVTADQIVITDARFDLVEWVAPPPPPAPPPENVTSGVCSPSVTPARRPVSQPPGARVCRSGSLSPAVKAFYVDRRRRQIYVAFGAKGALQVLLVRGAGDREILLRQKRYTRTEPARQVKVRYRPSRRGRWHVRVRAPGGCHQSKPFRL